MISSTLRSCPACNIHCSHSDLVSERYQDATAFSRFPNYAAQAWANNTRWVSRAISLAKLGTRNERLRASDGASDEKVCGFQRALLCAAREKRLQAGYHRSSSSQGRRQLFGLGQRRVTFDGTDRNENPKRGYTRSIIRSSSVDDGNENEYCDRLQDQPYGACSFRRSSNPNKREGGNYVEVPENSDPDQSGYTIRVSKELMGVFRYVEKVKRARIKELADTLRQTAAACMFFSCVRGIVGPLVEVFKTKPPSWGRLIVMLSAFDSFAITYLALKASEPLEKLSVLASETDKDIMGSIEKEEEHMLALAVELVKLFRRLRNITVCTAVAQFASLVHSLLRLNNPKFVASATKIIGAWLNTPWN